VQRIAIAVSIGGVLSLIIALVAANRAVGQGLPPGLAPGQVVSDFYTLVAAEPGQRDACEEIVASINTSKVYDPDNLWAVLLGTPLASIWERSRDGKEWHAPAVVGEIPPNLDADSADYPDHLAVDINGDGKIDHLYRVVQAFHSQAYTSIYVRSDPLPSDEQNGDLELSLKTAEASPSITITPQMEGDFYLMDVIWSGGAPLILAATSVRGGDDQIQATAFVLTVAVDYSLHVKCVLQSDARV